MKSTKFNLSMTTACILSINVFCVQYVRASEIEQSISSSQLLEHQSHSTDENSPNIGREPNLELAQNQTKQNSPREKLRQRKINKPKPTDRLSNAEAYNDRGNERATAGDDRGAIADFTEAIKLNPKFTEAYNSRGNARVILGDKQGALDDFNKAIQLNPKDGEAYNNRGNLRASIGDKPGAIADFTEAIKLNPKFTEAYNNRGNTRVILGDKQGALDDFNKAIQLNPKDGEAYNNRGSLRADIGDRPGALVDFDRAIQLNPKYTEAYNNRGNLRVTLGNKQGALADFDRAIQLDPKDGQAYNNRGNLRIELDDKKGALADFDKAIQIDPKDGGAYSNRGNLRINLEDKQGALTDFNKAIELNPNDGEIYNNRGNLRVDLGDKKGALTDFDRAIQLNPKLTEAYSSRGNAREALGDKQGALADFNQAIQLNPNSADFYKSRGYLRWSLSDKQGALADLNQAIRLNPKSGAEDYDSRGNIRNELGDKQGAISDFDRAISLNPKDANFYTNRGNVRNELGDTEGANADFNRAIQLNPKSTEIYNNRGNARAKLGDKEGAIADFERAMAINPKDAEAYNNRGSIRAEREDRQGAVADFDRAIALKPDYTEAINNRRNVLFSTTPKLLGELVFGVAGISGSNATRNLSPLSKESVNLLASASVTTSFTGYDRFLARFQTSAFGAPSSTDPRGYITEGRLASTDGTLNNQPGLQALTYQFPVSPSTEVLLAAKGGDSTENIAGANINPYFSGGGSRGAISYFGSTPSFYYHANGTGIGIQQKLGSQFELGAGYLGQTGLFSGESAVLARLLYKPSERSKIGLTYVNSDRTQTGTGSRNVNEVYLQSKNQAVGLESFYQVSPSLGFGGWIGSTASNAANGSAQSLSWAVSAAFPNLGGNGHVGGLLVGQEPRITRATGDLSTFADPSSSLHLELFYQYKINNNLSITPGLIYLTAPDSNGQNAGSLVGAIRANLSIAF
jgi:tetratricopeptide (TPR) repeat protein